MPTQAPPQNPKSAKLPPKPKDPKLSAALRANLQRRKAAGKPATPTPKSGE